MAKQVNRSSAQLCASCSASPTAYLNPENRLILNTLLRDEDQDGIYRTNIIRRVRQGEACPPATKRYKLRINLRNTKRFGWQPSATSRGTGNGSALSHAAISSPDRGAVIRPR